jgi:hypothetical protein
MKNRVEDFVNEKWNEISFHSCIDIKYAIRYYKKELLKWGKFINNSSVIAQDIYHLYMMGSDVSEVLCSPDFYWKYFYQDPNFFEKKENLTSN